VNLSYIPKVLLVENIRLKYRTFSLNEAYILKIRILVTVIALYFISVTTLVT